MTIPAGLAPGQTVPYQTSVTLPSYAHARRQQQWRHAPHHRLGQPESDIAESNYRNDSDLGPPYDSAPILIEAPKPCRPGRHHPRGHAHRPDLGQHHHRHRPDHQPRCRQLAPDDAILSFTPSGLTYGDPTTVGIGTITVPPLGAYQTINLVQNVTLPAVEPLAITNYTNFGLTMTQDADYVTNDLYPNQPTRGSATTRPPITITTSSTSTATSVRSPTWPPPRSLPRPAPTLGPDHPGLHGVQNVGQGDAGSFQVFFLLTGQAGSINDAIYLGQTTVSSLASGGTPQITSP